MSFVVSGLVAMSVRGRRNELPRSGTVVDVGIVGAKRRAVIPIRSRRRRYRRRGVVLRRGVAVVISGCVIGGGVVIARPVVRARPAEERPAAHDHGGMRRM